MDETSLRHLRHSCTHLLAAAVLKLWPDTKLTIGPAIENGFYYDFDFAQPVSEKDFPRIEAKMRDLVKSWQGFEKTEVDGDEAKKRVGDNPYKHELIDEIVQKGEKITFYKSGEFEDLCRGGHCEKPSKELKHFKLLSIAGAYWRGSEKNKMLTRIYGTCFPSKEELDHHLAMQEEAKKRDHRKLGQELELFFIDEKVGKGLVMWLPKGTVIRDQIEALAIKTEKKYGYVKVVTPHIAKEDLYIQSGHLPYYRESMYPPMKMDDGTYYLKAMNCPHHHRMYQYRPRSYRELPLRIAEYGTCYRNELSGTLAGLLRVRAMAMNDAHIYCTREQIEDEFRSVLKMTMDYFRQFDLHDYWFRLSKWSPENKDKYIDEPENWKYSEQILRDVLTKLNVKFVEADDEAAFYGPKVDVQFKSVIGREETMSTIQLDFAAKKRFGLAFIDDTGKEVNDIFVIHRAPLSVHERFLAFLLEHYAGAFPVWLAPVQVAVLPVSEKHIDRARQLLDALLDADVRAELNADNKTLGAKIRDATLQKIPYMIIIGDKEVEHKDLVGAVRTREGSDLGLQTVSQLLQTIQNANKT